MEWKRIIPKNPVLFALIAIFFIVNIVDSITAFFILPGESNPLFLIFNSIWVLIFFKFVIVGAIIFYAIRNKYPSNFMSLSLLIFTLL